MKTRLLTFAALALLLGPSAAFAHPITSTGTHTRSQMVHDRTPRYHDRGPVAHH